MIKRKTTLWAVLLLTGLLAACSGNTSTPTSTPTSMPQPPAATSTTAITLTPTVAPIVWGGDHPTVQMDLIGTITSGSTPLGEVRGLAFDQKGDLYVADTGNSRVLKFDPGGKFLMQWGSQGTSDGQFVMSGGSANHDNGDGFVAVDSELHHGKSYFEG